MSKVTNREFMLSQNRNQKHILGHNPSIYLTGVTKDRLWLTGTGELDLHIANGVIDSHNALKVEGFDRVNIYDGNLFGGIQGKDNKTYVLSDLSIRHAWTGININQPEQIELIDLHNVHITQCTGEGVYFGPNRATRPWIKTLRMTDCVITNCERDNFQAGGVLFGDIQDCIFTNNLKSRELPKDINIEVVDGIYVRRKGGQDMDVMVNPYATLRFKNCLFETFFVHNNSNLYYV